MKSAMITGATGAIGLALIDKLLAEGVKVNVLLREDSPRAAALPQHERLTVTWCSLKELRSLMPRQGEKADVFYHLGWQGTTGDARNDLFLQEENIRYTMDAAAAAKRFGCRLFIGAGSQAEYGRSNEALRPDSPTSPETGYGSAKLIAGQLSRILCEELGIGHIWCRILSVYGPGNSRASMLISVADSLRKGERPALTEGVQIWDYLYAADAAEALFLLAEKGVSGKTYVLGSGQARPLKEFIEELRDEAAPGAELGFGEIPYSPKQVMYLQADISELTRDTGWQPKTSFREGVRLTLDKYR